MTLTEYREKTDKHLMEYMLAKKIFRQEEDTLQQLKVKVEDTLTAQKILQQLAEQVQQQAHQQIAHIVTRCLEAVFDSPYEFSIEFERKRGKTEARLVFKRDGKVCRRVGGGVRDVTAFALRLACLLLTRPAPRRLLCLDEPFKFLHSKKYQERLRFLITSMSKEMGVQIIMVTQRDDLHAGKIIQIG